MKRILVWDLPTRLFHWLLAASFFVAFAIGTLVDDDSRLFSVHMLLGAIMVFMVALRVVWGFVGTRYARFRSFAFGPGAVLEYLKGAPKRWIGHNPGSSVAIWAVIALTFGLGLSGAFMSRGGELLEELHEIFAWALMAVVVVHVAGVMWHSLRHRENLTASMVDGRKQGEPSAAIRGSRPLVALLFLALTAGWAGSLVNNYDAARDTVTVPLIGTTLSLGEGEGEARGGGAWGDDDDDSDD